MGHVPHLIHLLFEETKVGGVAAVIGALIAGLIAYDANPFIVEACWGEGVISTPVCNNTLDEEALAADLLVAVFGGGIGVIGAMFLADRGVIEPGSKDD